jgi:hypothetical protein
MSNQTTYALLVRSKETSRDLLEAAVYGLCVLSAIFAIWQFVAQSSRLSVDGLVSRPHSAPVISHHPAGRHLGGGSS